MAKKKKAIDPFMENIVSLCKRRGFIFQSSEIYGGLGSCWDYGPLGVELKNNIKRLWWEVMTHRRDDVEGLDAAILMHPKVWEASGHIDGFTDPMVDCKKCKRRFRFDHLLEASPKRYQIGNIEEDHRQYQAPFPPYVPYFSYLPEISPSSTEGLVLLY